MLQILCLRPQGNKQVECIDACSTQIHSDFLDDIFLTRAFFRFFGGGGEIFFWTKIPTLLQIFQEFTVDSQLIFKSITGPDDTAPSDPLI